MWKFIFVQLSFKTHLRFVGGRFLRYPVTLLRHRRVSLRVLVAFSVLALTDLWLTLIVLLVPEAVEEAVQPPEATFSLVFLFRKIKFVMRASLVASFHN